MSKKKNLGRGIDAILGGLKTEPRESEGKQSSDEDLSSHNLDTDSKKTAKRAVEEKGERGARVNVWIEKEIDKRIRALSYLERKPMRELVEQALGDYIQAMPEGYVEKALATYSDRN